MNHPTLPPLCPRRGALATVARALAVWLALLAWTGSAEAGAFGSKYRTSGRCGPYARVLVKTPPWLCLGIVAGPEHGMIWPRSILEIGEGRFAITDAAGWFARRRARVLALAIKEDGRASVAPLFTGRNLTHGLAMGPDGRVYVGDDDAIWRFDPKSAQPEPETLLTGLPGKPSRGGDHFHPMKQIVFDKDRNLLVNMGAPNDRCERGPDRGTRFPYPCPWREGDKPDAALWKLELTWPDGRPGAFGPLARGLRNSVALAVHPTSGLIIQGENNIDIWGVRLEADIPPEELNVIVPGRDYGWPYCAGNGQVTPDYRGKIAGCARFEAPFALMPAHVAPLALLYYQGAMFPELEGKLVAAWHSGKRAGHRIVAYDTDAEGHPRVPEAAGGAMAGIPEVLVDRWTSADEAGTTGHPSSLTVAKDGAIWLVDDVARTVMVLLRAGPGGEAPRVAPQPAQPTAAAPAGWDELLGGVLAKRCRDCHEPFRLKSPAAVWRALSEAGMLDPDDVAGSLMVKAMLGDGALRPMPPPTGLSQWPDDLAALNRFLQGLGK